MDTQRRELLFFSGSNNFVDFLQKECFQKGKEKKKKKLQCQGEELETARVRRKL